MSLIERSNVQCPFLGGSFIRDLTVFPMLNNCIIVAAGITSVHLHVLLARPLMHPLHKKHYNNYVCTHTLANHFLDEDLLVSGRLLLKLDDQCSSLTQQRMSLGRLGDTVPPTDSVDVGVAVGGHDHSVPHGGHGKSGEYQENTLAAPCKLEHIRPSLRLEKPRVGLKARILVSSDGWGQYPCWDGDRIEHITL